MEAGSLEGEPEVVAPFVVDQDPHRPIRGQEPVSRTNPSIAPGQVIRRGHPVVVVLAVLMPVMLLLFAESVPASVKALIVFAVRSPTVADPNVARFENRLVELAVVANEVVLVAFPIVTFCESWYATDVVL